MPGAFKEILKFSLLTLFCLGVVIAACFVARPYALVMDETRRVEVVQFLVPGTVGGSAIRVKDGADSLLVYRPSKSVSVVFMPVHLFLRDMDLALQVENNQVVRMVDLTPGLAPFNPGLRRLFSDRAADRGKSNPGDLLAHPGADAVGGATIDYSRLAALLDRVVSIVRKAGSK